MMRMGIMAAVLAVTGAAHAQQDPMEAAAAAQVAAQAPGATQAAPFFRGIGKKTDFQILLEAGKCYWWAGVGGPGVKKLALYLWGPGAGAFTPRLTDAKSPTANATMAHCPSMSGMHKFQVKTEGEGPTVVGLYAKVAPTPAAAPPPAAMVAPAPVADVLGPTCDNAAATAAPGSKRQGPFFDNQGGRMDKVDYSVAMEVGKCYWVVGCGAPGQVKALSLFLWGPDNKRITEAKPDSPNAMLGHCPTMPGMFKVQSKIASGGGPYKVGVYYK
jgi:hypothetical protein